MRRSRGLQNDIFAPADPPGELNGGVVVSGNRNTGSNVASKVVPFDTFVTTPCAKFGGSLSNVSPLTVTLVQLTISKPYA